MISTHFEHRSAVDLALTQHVEHTTSFRQRKHADRPDLVPIARSNMKRIESNLKLRYNIT